MATPEKNKEGEARGLEGRVRQVRPPLPRIDPFPGGTAHGPPSLPSLGSFGTRLADSRAEPPWWGLRWGREGITPGFQEKKGGKEEGGMWTPSPRWDGGGDLRALKSSVPVPARTFPKSQTRRSSHRLGFCVLGSGTLTAHHPTKEIHLAAKPPILPAPSQKKTSPALRRAWPQGPHSTLPSHGHHRLLLADRSSPPSPETATTSSRDAHARGTWHYVAARRAKAKRVGERRPVARVRPSPTHRAGTASIRRDTPSTAALRWLLRLASVILVVEARPYGL